MFGLNSINFYTIEKMNFKKEIPINRVEKLKLVSLINAMMKTNEELFKKTKIFNYLSSENIELRPKSIK